MRVIDVPAADGLRWIKVAWLDHFRKAPLAWVALLGLWIIVTFMLLIVPIIGQIAANVLQPVFFAGFMLACRAQEQGADPQMSRLFAGFKGKIRALVVVGAVMLLGEILLLLALQMMGLPELRLSEDGKKLDLDAFRESLDGKEWMIVLFFVASGIFKGSLWFTPPLLAFHDMRATHAMRWSIYAFLSNFSALLVYGIGIVAIFTLAILPYGAGLFIALPLMAISNYTGYRAMFVENELTVETAAPEPADPGANT